MAKTIAVWGSPGSGKTLFSCILATELTQNRQKAVIISIDQFMPMLPVLLPEQQTDKESSINALFQAEQVTPLLTARAVHILKDYPYIGVMGYCKEEIPIECVWASAIRIKELLSVLDHMVDYIIWDCTSDIGNCMNTAILEYADVTVQLLTADLKGIHFYGTCKKALQSELYHFEDAIKLIGMARPYHVIDEVDYIVGGVKGICPFNKELERCALEGNYFNAISCCHEKYLDAIDYVIEQIQEIPNRITYEQEE